MAMLTAYVEIDASREPRPWAKGLTALDRCL
jgi:hypothetical protein